MEERSARSKVGNPADGKRGLEVENGGKMLKLYKVIRVEIEVKSL